MFNESILVSRLLFKFNFKRFLYSSSVNYKISYIKLFLSSNTFRFFPLYFGNFLILLLSNLITLKFLNSIEKNYDKSDIKLYILNHDYNFFEQFIKLE